MNREELIAYDRWLTENKWGSSEIITPEQAADLYLAKHPLPPAEGAEKLKEMEELFNLEQQLDIPMKDRFHNSAKGKELFAAIQNKPHSTAEGAEEILESIVESLGEPINIHNHIFEIRPYTVEHETEWWIFHKEVGSGEPLAQWLSKFATLHAQRIADKMVSERLRDAPKNCPKAAQCAHVVGGMKCPPNVICPI